MAWFHEGAFVHVVVILLVFLPGVIPDATAPPPAETPSWCIAQRRASMVQLQVALDWVCGPGQADCSATLPGQPCYLPNNAKGHASYAFNNYYQKNNKAYGSCNFSFLATVTYHDPSYGSCFYPSHL